MEKINNLMFYVKKLLTRVKSGVIVQLTINIKNLFFIVRFLARVLWKLKIQQQKWRTEL